MNELKCNRFFVFFLVQARCELLVKEREAVHTIMEQKIKVLVQGVANALGAVLQNTPQAGGSAGAALSKVSERIKFY